MITSAFRLFAALLVAFPLAAAAAARDDGEGTGSCPAAPLGEWRVGPMVTKDGGFAYCIAESRFDNGRSLTIARSRRGEINLGLGMPSAHLTKGDVWPVTLRVDGDYRRERKAVAADPGMLVIGGGSDGRLIDALTHGETLTIRGPSDTLAFRLKGTGTAMAELARCAEQNGGGKPAAPLGSVAASPLQLPPLLKHLLADAGFKTIGLMHAAATPPGLEPPDYLWKAGSVTAGMSELASNRSLPDLAAATLGRLRPHCAKAFTANEGETDTLPHATLRTLDATCTAAGGTTRHLAFLFDLGNGGLLKAFFFQAPTADAASHDRNAVAAVLKQAESR